jgi:7-keto-8-aminopelargonate synthetase-like enzyme
VVLDKLVHASIVDAARLSGAKLRVFAHNDLNDLAEILAWSDGIAGKAGPAAKRPRVLVITESVFSMDGDQAPLRELVELKARHGAWLMVDEAHATGLYGARRRGLIEAAGVTGRVEVQMGTLGKALGSAGGYVCGSRVLTDFLVNRARSFIFSTAPTPATAAAATAAVRLVQSPAGEERCRQLWERVAQFQRGFGRAATSNRASAIIPIPVGDETRAMTLAARLREHGVFVPAVRYPTVARGQARLRVTFTAAHTGAEVEKLCENLRAVGTATSGAA